MSTQAGQGMHPALRAFPGAVVELGPDGVVVDSNGRMERVLGRPVVGSRLEAALDRASRLKLEQLLVRRGEQGACWELMVEGPDTVHPIAFHPVWEEDPAAPRLWLVEAPRDPRLELLHEELASANSEQAGTQRQLAKEKARLGRALDELERELGENAKLARALQAQNEEMEAQNHELLAMTEELHAGQEQLMQLNHQLERRTRELQLALSARNRFYANMSHELRTPINAVMGYNDLLLASIYGPLGEQQELAIERSQRAARHLRELVNDVLDISRLEVGKPELVVEEVDVPSLAEEVFAGLRPMADSTGAVLRVSASQRPLWVRTDRGRLRHVISNLLSNAIKFGKGAPVWVNCSRAHDGGMEIEVVDGGDGIAPEDQARVFDEFVQLARYENDESAGHDGTGLGLPIALRVAALLGGTLEVASTPGVGSTFRLILPPWPPAPL